MWEEIGFRFSAEFDEIVLSLMSDELRETCERFIKSKPENPQERAFRPLFCGLDSLMITLCLEGSEEICRSKKFRTLTDFVRFLEDTLSSNRRLFFKSLNRDENGNLGNFPHLPLPGEPALRVIFDIFAHPRSIPPEIWAETPVRFHLYFRPELQEYFSSDSGLSSPENYS